VSTQDGYKDNEAMGRAIARSARCTRKGRELATTFDCAPLANETRRGFRKQGYWSWWRYPTHGLHDDYNLQGLSMAVAPRFRTEKPPASTARERLEHTHGMVETQDVRPMVRDWVVFV
jgi:hypothetical protein